MPDVEILSTHNRGADTSCVSYENLAVTSELIDGARDDCKTNRHKYKGPNIINSVMQKSFQ